MRKIYAVKPFEDDKRWDLRWPNEDFVKQWDEKLNCKHVDFIIEGIEKYIKKTHNKNPEILKLAAGTAPYSKFLNDKGFDITMSDYSEVAVKKFNEITGIKSIKIDFRNMSNIKSESYDIIVLIGGIYEFDDFYTPEIAYKEIFRVLKPEGFFYSRIKCLAKLDKKYYIHTIVFNIKNNYPN